MITIYKTNTMKDASEYVLDVIAKIDKSNLSVTHTVIVPDRASLEAERALLKKIGGSFNVQVKTFRRLANDILPKLEYLSKQAGIMALSGIIKDNRDRLSCYVKGAETAGFAADIYDVICMLKYCKISPRMLNNDNLPQSVKGKVKDIALLYEAYIDFTSDRFIDSADKLDLLRDNMETSKTFTDGYFYIYDFDNFSKQELQIVEKLALVSKGVTVACCVGENYEDKYLYLNDIYNGLLDVCSRNGIEPAIIDGKGYANKYVKHIGDNLFRYKELQPIDSNGFAEIFQGATRAQEVYALACKIEDYVRRGGRYKDVYVVTSDVNCYFNAVSLTFSDFNIPYFLDRQYVLSSQPYARFVLDFLTLRKNNGKLKNVLEFVKNVLFIKGISGNNSRSDDVYHFENYCLKYNVSYRYDEFTLGKSEPYFIRADSFRKEFNNVFKMVDIPSCATVKEYVALTRGFISEFHLDEINEKFASEQERRGFVSEAKATKQASEKFSGVLTQAENVVGNRVVPFDEFIKMISVGADALLISVLPVANDCVIFANMAKARKHDVKFLALLGANYGAMPIIKSDCSLLSDNNIRTLSEYGVNVEPQILTENKRERFSLFQLLQEPTEKLYVSYAEVDGASALTPSPFVKELCTLFCDGGEKLKPIVAADEKVYTVKQALSKLILNKRKLKDNQPVNMPTYTALSRMFAEKVNAYDFGKNGREIYVNRGEELYLKNSATSVSQLTDFFKCPYRFYIQYGLNVKPRAVAELKTADLGNILHAVLEFYVKEIVSGESDPETEAKAERCFEAAMSDDFYKGLQDDPHFAWTLDQLKEESIQMCKVVKKQLSESEFVNLETELGFGVGDGAPAVEVAFDGGKFSLVGKIDRVDAYKDRFIVIDYKSGANAAKYSEKDLYIGHKLQLPVYVKAARDLYNKRPAGFYYFNMHDNFTEIAKDKVYVYNGRTLNDVETACALDINLKKGSSEKLNLKLKKDGSLSQQSKSLLNDEQFDNQVEYAFMLIRKAGNLMKKGYAAINPYEGVCDYCDYKAICGFGDVHIYEARDVKDTVNVSVIDKTVKK